MPSSPGSAPTTASSSLSLRDFWRLPHELRQRILSLACRSPIPTETDLSNRSTLTLDMETTLNLALVSRQLCPHIMAILYHSPKITTISALRSLHFALTSRPVLGRLVKGLHLGPADDLPRHWWPLVLDDEDEDGRERDFPEFWIRTSLDEQDEDKRPHWCPPHQQWHLLGWRGPRAPWHHELIDKAMRAALKSLDVNILIHHCPWDNASDRIGRDAWATKIWLLQACLDLYLMELRKIDDASGTCSSHGVAESAASRRSSSRHQRQSNCYPELVVAATPEGVLPVEDSGSVDDSKPVIRLTWTQLYSHLARQGSLTDRFDNPLLLARSGLLTFDAWGPLSGDSELRDAPYSLRMEKYTLADGDLQDFADLFSSGDGQDYEEGAAVRLPVSLTNVLDPALSRSASIGSMLALARSVLSYTSTLENLSLSSFLERAVCGSRPSPPLKALRALSLGPPPPYWYLTLSLEHTTFHSVQKLRLCGITWLASEAASIAGIDGELPALRELQYSTPYKTGQRTKPRVKPSLRETLPVWKSLFNLLNAQPEGNKAATAGNTGCEDGETSRKRRRDSASNGDDDCSGRDEGPHRPSYPNLTSRPTQSLYIDARLHPDEVAKLLDKAPTAAVRAAWRKGAAAPEWSHHRLRVSMTRVPVENDHESDDEVVEDPPEVPQELYDEGQEWWAECAGKVAW